MDFTRATEVTPEVAAAVDDAFTYHAWTIEKIAWSAGLLVVFWLCVLFVSRHMLIRESLIGASKWLTEIIVFLSVTFGTVVFGVNVWPHLGLDILSIAEQNRFADSIRGSADPKWLVRLMCPPNEEKECVVAAPFVRVFDIAGLPLTGQSVEREVNGTPSSGLYFVLHSDRDIDYRDPVFRDPNVGLWTETPGSYYKIRQAFYDLGITTHTVIGKSFPPHVLGIYFGTGTARQ